jgi:hypothetical protein
LTVSLYAIAMFSFFLSLPYSIAMLAVLIRFRKQPHAARTKAMLLYIQWGSSLLALIITPILWWYGSGRPEQLGLFAGIVLSYAVAGCTLQWVGLKLTSHEKAQIWPLRKLYRA